MTDELDNFLNRQQEQLEKDEQAQRELLKKQQSFTYAFKETLQTIIHPAMIAILDKLRFHNHLARVIHDKNTAQYYHEDYYIGPNTGDEKYFIISVAGNYDIEKVCISTEYFDSFFEDGKRATKQLKKTEEQYALSQITPGLFAPIVLKAMNEVFEKGNKK